MNNEMCGFCGAAGETDQPGLVFCMARMKLVPSFMDGCEDWLIKEKS